MAEECNHYWRYNFPSIPNKRICTECFTREKLDLHTLKWSDSFDDLRTDEELISSWF